MLRRYERAAIFVKLNAEPGAIRVGIKTIGAVTQVRDDLVPRYFLAAMFVRRSLLGLIESPIVPTLAHRFARAALTLRVG
jgi:hypothetical protein